MKLAKRYVASVCRKSAKILEVNGWRQGSVGFEGGPRCLAGAINEVVGGSHYHTENPRQRSVLLTVRKYLTQEPYIGYGPIVARWNDAPGRTKDEVCSKLREVARKLEHGGEL